MIPEPSPLLWLELASTETVDGSTLLATSCTEPAGAGVRSATAALVLSWESELSTEFRGAGTDLGADEPAAEAGEQGDRGGGRHDD